MVKRKKRKRIIRFLGNFFLALVDDDNVFNKFRTCFLDDFPNVNHGYFSFQLLSMNFFLILITVDIPTPSFLAIILIG